MRSHSRAHTLTTLPPLTGKTEPYWLSFFWLELNWASGQYEIHFLEKFYRRCPVIQGSLVIWPYPHISNCIFHYTPSCLSPLSPSFASSTEFLASTSCTLDYRMSFYTRTPLPEILYALHVIATRPSRPHSLMSYPLWSLPWFLQADLVTPFPVSQQHAVQPQKQS